MKCLPENELPEGFRSLCHERENTLSKSRFCLLRLGLGSGLWKTLNAFVNGVASKKDKPIYGETHIRSNPVRRQVDCGDCGATVSIIPRSHISDTQLKPFKISLGVWNIACENIRFSETSPAAKSEEKRMFSQAMWNEEKMNALGTCKLSLQNPKTSQKYMVNFDVFSRKSSSPCQVPNQLRR